jgi:outer membrane protein
MMRQGCARPVIFAAAALVVALAAPCAGALTLEEALASAEQNNPSLEEARLGVRSARENRVQARAGYLPSIDLNASYGGRTIETQQPGFTGAEQRTHADLRTSSVSTSLTQQLYTGGRRAGQTRLAEAFIEGARQDLRSVEQDVALSVIEAFLRVRRDSEIERLREGHVSSLDEQLRATARRLDVGDVSRTDLAQAQSRLAGARAALASARSDLESARARFIEVVGQAPVDLAAPPPQPAAPESLDAAMAYAGATHPLILRAREIVDASRARVAIERAALRPHVTFEARRDRYEDSDFNNQIEDVESAVAQVSIPLFEGGFASSRTRQSRVNVSRAEAVVEAQRREIVAGVASAWNELIASRQVVDAAREQVAASETALDGAEREQGLGLRSTIDVLDAERERQEAQIALARAEAQAGAAIYVLRAAMGVLTLAATTSEP